MLGYGRLCGKGTGRGGGGRVKKDLFEIEVNDGSVVFFLRLSLYLILLN
mgnify:CR=1 FL=1